VLFSGFWFGEQAMTRIQFLTVLLCFVPFGTASADSGTEFFEAKIRPVLVEQCYKCHSSDAQKNGKLKGGLLLDTREATRMGGESGPAVVPNDAKKSLLLSALRHQDFEMPPKGKLPSNVIADFQKWIEMGAPDPRDGQGIVQTKIDLVKGRQFWAFKSAVDTDPPKVNDDKWVRADFDRFILRKLETNKLQPAADATMDVLARRLSFDLVGLPPDPRRLKQLSNTPPAKRQEAIEEFVDELLASEQFGERWARHWLDVARYAESNGNTRNATFPFAWRYRDYVIDAFNADLPFDQFARQQIAGDVIKFDSIEETNAGKVATGFLALASKPMMRGKGKGGFQPEIVADQIEVTTRAFMGLTVACARCHDHKFDPIPTTDYYALASVFSSSDTLYGGGGSTMGAFAVTGLHSLESKDKDATARRKVWEKQVADLMAMQKTIAAKVKKSRPSKKTKANDKQKNKDKQKENDKQRDKDKKRPVDSKTVVNLYAELVARQKEVGKQLKALQAQEPQGMPQAMGVREGKKVTLVPIHVRGESPKGNPIERGLLSVIDQMAPPSFDQNSSGRLQLADWIADPANPLTARVAVNRIWLHLFGEGLVRTPDNFGLNGDRPTHPELLDWLATRFVEDGWSVKRLIRRIVLSRTYQLSNEHISLNYKSDPDNIYHWRHNQRRLEAEAIRDAILFASGKLDRTRPNSSPVEAVGSQLIQDKLTPETIHKPSVNRSIYLAMMRNGLPEMMEVFDVADPSLVVGRRNTTTVPAQELFLMNSPFVLEQAELFARQITEATSDESERIRLAYHRAVSRAPSEDETNRALEFVKGIETQSSEDDDGLGSWASLCQALFISAEFRHVQ
jgi:hypothetical protein